MGYRRTARTLVKEKLLSIHFWGSSTSGTFISSRYKTDSLEGLQNTSLMLFNYIYILHTQLGGYHTRTHQLKEDIYTKKSPKSESSYLLIQYVEKDH